MTIEEFDEMLKDFEGDSYSPVNDNVLINDKFLKYHLSTKKKTAAENEITPADKNVKQLTLF